MREGLNMNTPFNYVRFFCHDETPLSRVVMESAYAAAILLPIGYLMMYRTDRSTL